jgi:membrane-anchored protein YejM (alkaline phosphatase superfamily)
MPVAVLIAALGLVLLVLDTNLFVERRFHLSLFIAVLLETATWVVAGVVFLIALAFEAMLAGALHRRLEARNRPGGGRLLAATLTLCWLSSQGLHIWADAVGYSPVTRFSAILPLYFPVHGIGMLARLGWLDEERVEQARLLRQGASTASGDLNYPLQPLRCPGATGSSPNVLWILIDALRPDAIDPVTSPAMVAFRGAGQSFANHWSGGNSSRMGLFSMYYGLPSTYWQDFYALQRPPVLLDELRRQGYELMTSSAVGYGSPTLIDRTVFAGVAGLNPELPVSGVEKNRAVTADWLAWVGPRKAVSPFFAFLYYDPPMSKGSGTADLAADDRYPANAQARTRWQQYRQGVHMVDGEVARVLDALDAAGLQDNTLVIITSDHGYEFDDLGLGYYGHASNFGAYQLRATLLMRWPGKAAQVYEHRTSHMDLPATLLEDLLGCTNPPGDYSVGRNLFDGVSWDWIIAGSYHAHAIVEPGKVMISEPGGFAEVLGADYRPAAEARLDPQRIKEAMGEMRRFYR